MDAKGRVYWEHQKGPESIAVEFGGDLEGESKEDDSPEPPQLRNCFHIDDDKIMAFL